jgi:hypothetical protein
MQHSKRFFAVALLMFTFITITTSFPSIYLISPAVAQSDETESDLESRSSTVSGTYIAPGGLVEMTLIDGWEGFEHPMADNATTVMIAIKNSNNTNIEFQDLANYSAPVISLITILHTVDTDNSNSQSGDNISTENIASLMKGNTGKYQCTLVSDQFVRINEVEGEDSVFNCKDSSDKSFKMRTIKLESTKYTAFAVYSSESQSFESQMTEFANTLKSLKVFGAADIFPSQRQLISSSFAVIANGQSLNFEVQSSSTIENVTFDEVLRQVNIKMSENSLDDDDHGITIVPIGQIMEGPYVVTMDGKAFDGVEMVREEPSGRFLITLEYTSGEHDFSISGTRVVPEFSGLFVIQVSVAILVVTVLATTKKSILHL